MRTGSIVAIVLVFVVFTPRGASLAGRALPVAELIDVNRSIEHNFCQFDASTDSCPYDFTALANDVAFIALVPGIGFGLWRTDGSRAGTTLIRDVNSIRLFSNLVAGNGVLFFAGFDRSGQYGIELWRSDGTFNGTAMVADLNPGPADSQSFAGPQLLNAGGMLYFAADDGVSGSELWKIEAGRSVPGTQPMPRPELVKDIYPGPDYSGPNGFAFTGSTLFFAARDADHGYELWKSDGTAAGTLLVKDIVPGPGWSFPNELVPFGDRVLFSPSVYDDDAVNGLWISDGTESGTFKLGPPFSGEVVVAGTRAFFSAYRPETGGELWVTDGTVAGTHVIDAVPGPGSLFPTLSAAVGNNVVFSATGDVDPSALYEPWISDGTVEGTRLLKKIDNGPYSSGAWQYISVRDVAFFTATDSKHGEELWVTDGTTEGTRLVRDINHGTDSSIARQMKNIKGVLYMSADDGVHGFEPWRVTP